MLEREGVDLIEISGGSYENAVMMGVDAKVRESTRSREAYFLEYAEKVRQVVATPLMLTGGFRSLDGMAAALQSGAVDVVGLGRPLCVEPDLPARLLDGTAETCVITPKQVGIREIDTILEVFWYTQQLHRLAAGMAPARDRGLFVALLITLWTALWDTVRLKRQR